MTANRALNELRKYGSALLAEEGAGAEAPRPDRAGLPWPSLRIALPTLVLLIFGNIGLVAAADSAVPGDPLYPVDRAYESIAELLGFDTGASSERLAEASVLLAEGKFDAAVSAIGASVSGTDGPANDRINEAADQLAAADTASLDREDLHRSVAALGSTVAALTASGDDPAMWVVTIDASSQAVIDVAAGLPFEPTGHGDNFVPPGLDDDFTPPGQEDGSLPPGQDDDRVPPGRDEDRVPPGQDEDRVPPGQDEDRVPPGQDEDRVPPGQEDKGKKGNSE